MSKLSEFKRELKELLNKYDASIQLGFANCSDTHGMYDERIEVSFRVNRPRFQYQTHTLSKGYGISKGDL